MPNVSCICFVMYNYVDGIYLLLILYWLHRNVQVVNKYGWSIVSCDYIVTYSYLFYSFYSRVHLSLYINLIQ